MKPCNWNKVGIQSVYSMAATSLRRSPRNKGKASYDGKLQIANIFHAERLSHPQYVYRADNRYASVPQQYPDTDTIDGYCYVVQILDDDKTEDVPLHLYMEQQEGYTAFLMKVAEAEPSLYW